MGRGWISNGGGAGFEWDGIFSLFVYIRGDVVGYVTISSSKVVELWGFDWGGGDWEGERRRRRRRREFFGILFSCECFSFSDSQDFEKFSFF